MDSDHDHDHDGNQAKTDETAHARALIGRPVRLSRITGRNAAGELVTAGPFAAIVTGFDATDTGHVESLRATVFHRDSQQSVRIARPNAGEIAVGAWIESID